MKPHVCGRCRRRFASFASLRRHWFEKHGASHKLALKMRREARRAQRLAARHKDICYAVVETALRYWRTSMPKPGGGGDAEKFWRACATLEKYEST